MSSQSGNEMKRIDTSDSFFENFIKSDKLYVDKTKYLYNLLTDGRTYYFLSRPRRFGKSLTLSTLDAIFKGKRELFKGLYIDSTNYDWKEYPVIHIDFSNIEFISINNFRKQIKDNLLIIASKYNVKIQDDYEYEQVLSSLLKELAKRGKVVVLIDEYDSLIVHNMNSKYLDEILSVLNGFYAVLKASCKYIRFCFITGITKFTKMGIYPAMNNLVDISMSDEYSTMLGYTQEELEENFSEYIENGFKNGNATREDYLSSIKYWYDGYKFSAKGESVYNPVSIGQFFYNKGKLFEKYWINTGGSSLIKDMAKSLKFDISSDISIPVSEDRLRSKDIIQMTKTEVSKVNFMSLLYQTGYLTIRKAEIVGGSYLLTLGYPNEEVKEGLTRILLPLYLGDRSSKDEAIRILSLLYKEKINEALESFKRVYSSIPYNEIVFNKENAWHASFISMLRLMGADIVGEVTTNIGRIDAVLTCPRDIYIIEFKFNQSAEKAIEQIREKKYYESYLDTNKKIHLLGINFSTEEKNILEWKDEVIK